MHRICIGQWLCMYIISKGKYISLIAIIYLFLSLKQLLFYVITLFSYFK